MALATTFNDPGVGEDFETTIGPIAAGEVQVTVTPYSDTGVAGTPSVSTAPLSGAPAAPGEPAYVSGTIANTIIAFAASETASATYRFYDVQELNGPTFLEAVAATHIAGTGSLQLTLPALTMIYDTAVNIIQAGLTSNVLTVYTDTAHGYAVGDIVYLTFVDAPLTDLNGGGYVITTIFDSITFTVAAVHSNIAGDTYTGTVKKALGGARWGRLVSVLNGVEDSEQRKFKLTYNPDGTIHVDQPNIPSALVTSIANRTVSLSYTYDSTAEKVVATGIVLEYENQAGTVTTQSPTAMTSTETIKQGTLSATVGADGWYRFRVSARTADAVLSEASEWSEWYYCSAGVVGAPTNLVLTPIA